MLEKIKKFFSDYIKNLLERSGQIKSFDAVCKSIAYDENTDKRRLGFGDISCNAPLVLAKVVKKKPLDIGEEIAQNIKHPDIISINCVAPGFLNIKVSNDLYKKYIEELSSQTVYFFEKTENPLSYNIEFVSANPTGPLHIGHGRGGIIGDVLARVLKFRGHRVKTEYYINDAGSQIDKLARSFDIRCKQQTGENALLDDDMYQGEYLVKIAAVFCAENDHRKISYEEKKKYIVDKLLSYIKNNLSEYRVEFDTWFSEKTLHESNLINRVVERLQEKGFIFEKDGSLWLKTTDFGDDKDRVVKRSNGEWTYVAADIAYLIDKFERSFDKLIMILGQDHHSYVNRLKAATQALGYQANQLDVILYQLVTLKENDELLRLSKRSGRMVYLGDIIKAVGPDVARFFYLNKKADAHLEFDIALAQEESSQNPVYYIQYAYVRLKSILEKEKQILSEASSGLDDSEYQLNEYEKHIVRKIYTFNNILCSIERTYQTHLLAHYTLDFASLIHSWYAHCKIIDLKKTSAMQSRLKIVHVCMNLLSKCLHLLNVSQPDKM